jgi:hypothetical protein
MIAQPEYHVLVSPYRDLTGRFYSSRAMDGATARVVGVISCLLRTAPRLVSMASYLAADYREPYVYSIILLMSHSMLCLN